MSAHTNFSSHLTNGKNHPYIGGFLTQMTPNEITQAKIARLQALVVYLETELDWAKRLLDQTEVESRQTQLMPKETALPVIGQVTDGDDWTDTEEVRQFGLTVAYALVEAALSEEPALPPCFTADDLVLASDVLTGEMTRRYLAEEPGLGRADDEQIS